MIPGQLLANPGSGGEQDLALLSLCILLFDGRGCVEPGGGSQDETGGLGVLSPLQQPKASGGWTRVERHLALHYLENGDEVILD